MNDIEDALTKRDVQYGTVRSFIDDHAEAIGVVYGIWLIVSLAIYHNYRYDWVWKVLLVSYIPLAIIVVGAIIEAIRRKSTNSTR